MLAQIFSICPAEVFFLSFADKYGISRVEVDLDLVLVKRFIFSVKLKQSEGNAIFSKRQKKAARDFFKSMLLIAADRAKELEANKNLEGCRSNFRYCQL